MLGVSVGCVFHKLTHVPCNRPNDVASSVRLLLLDTGTSYTLPLAVAEVTMGTRTRSVTDEEDGDEDVFVTVSGSIPNT